MIKITIIQKKNGLETNFTNDDNTKEPIDLWLVLKMIEMTQAQIIAELQGKSNRIIRPGSTDLPRFPNKTQ